MGIERIARSSQGSTHRPERPNLLKMVERGGIEPQNRE